MSFAPSSRPKRTPQASMVRRNSPRFNFEPKRVEVVVKQKASKVLSGTALNTFVALMVVATTIVAAPDMLEAYYAYTDRLEDIGRARNRQRAWKNSQHKSSMMYIKKFSEFKISSIDAISKLAGVAPAAIGAAGNVTTEGITTVAEGAKNVLTVIQIGTKALSITASLVGPVMLASIMILLTMRYLGLPVNQMFETSVSTAMKGGKITIESLAKVFNNLTKVANKRDMNNAMVKSEGKVVNLNAAAKTIQNAWRAKKQRMNRASANKLNVLANVAANQLNKRGRINKTKLNALMNAAEKSLNN
jgi:hypothetical protein